MSGLSLLMGSSCNLAVLVASPILASNLLFSLLLLASNSIASPKHLNSTSPSYTNLSSSVSPPICLPPLNHSSTPVTTQTCTPILLDLSITSTSSDLQTFSSDLAPYVYQNRYSACTITLKAIAVSSGVVATVQLTTGQIVSSVQEVLDSCKSWDRGGNVVIGNTEGVGVGWIWVVEVSGREGWQVESLPRNVSQHLR